MNISGVGNTGIDYTRYASRQSEQEAIQQESAELQADQAVTIRQSSQTGSADSNESQTAGSTVAAISGEVAKALESGGESDDSGNQSLINKANAGSVLTKSELSRLKEIDPGLYSQTVRAEKAREELRQQMKQNPSGASRDVYSAIEKNGGEGQELIRKALMDEYQDFASKYDQVFFSR